MRRICRNLAQVIFGFLELALADHEWDERVERLAGLFLIGPLAGDVVADTDDPAGLKRVVVGWRFVIEPEVAHHRDLGAVASALTARIAPSQELAEDR